MIVIADTGPLNYLVLIGEVGVLQPLYTRVLAPEAVVKELQAAGAPAAVRAWIAQPPAWLESQPDPPVDPSLAFLDPGARLTAGSRVTRQAITKHLRVIEQAGLVRSRRRARETLWQLEQRRLNEARHYLDMISKQGDSALNRLRDFVEE